MLDEVLLRNSDNVMNERLEMSGHKIKGLGDPPNPDNAVNKEYITTRLNALTDVLNSILEIINKLERKKTINKMKQTTAPIYPELPIEDGQRYCLQKLSETEKQLIRERDAVNALYKSVSEESISQMALILH